jgi:hypothetical protein
MNNEYILIKAQTFVYTTTNKFKMSVGRICYLQYPMKNENTLWINLTKYGKRLSSETYEMLEK